MVATFPNISPDLESKPTYEPKILSAEFGDGYSQSGADGINAFNETWSLVFNHRTKTEIDTIDAFLKTANGYQSFYWTPPEETVLTPNPKKWISTGKITRSKQSEDVYSISFSIQRVFRP